MDDARDIVNAIHNACEWGSFETADACLEKYTKEKTRLAKIEVLEELLESINTPCVEMYANRYEEGIRDKRNDVVETIEARILELKEGN